MERELVQLERLERTLVGKAGEVQITSLETLQTAVGLTAEIKSAKSRVEEIRKFFVNPLNDQVRKINAKFKPFTETLEKMEAEVKSKIVVYQTEQEKIRIAEETRLRKLQEAEYAKQVKKAEKKGDDAPPPPPPVKVEAVKVDGLSIRKVWDFEIVFIEKIPLEYMIPDEKKIRKVITAGVREIPGIKIFEKSISAIKTADDEL